MMKKTILLSFLLTLSLSNIHAQGLINNNATIVMSDSAFITVDGNGSINHKEKSRLQIEKSGNFMLTGHWINESDSLNNNRAPHLIFIGTNHLIQDVDSSTFASLRLQNQGQVQIQQPITLNGNTNLLNLQKGILSLNGNALILANTMSDPIAYNTGGILAEGDTNELTGSVVWNIEDKKGHLNVPFVNKNLQPIPFQATIHSAGVLSNSNGQITIKSYPTNVNKAITNRPLPQGVENTYNEFGIENADLMIDRFWKLEGQGYDKVPQGKVTLAYHTTDYENGDLNGNLIDPNQLNITSFDVNEKRWKELVSEPTGFNKRAAIVPFNGHFSVVGPIPCTTPKFELVGHCEDQEIEFEDLTEPTIWPSVSRDYLLGDVQIDSTLLFPILLKADGNYRIGYIIENAKGCKDTTYKEVVIHARAKANFTFQNDFAIKDETFGFTNLSTNADDYDWDFGDGYYSYDKNPTNQYFDAGLKQVQLIANNDENCPDTMIKALDVTPEGLFFVPNAFSPANQDGINDKFGLFTVRPVHNYRMRIYDRKGTMVYESNDVNDKWDGKMKGRWAQFGHYQYNIQFKDQFGKEYEMNGLLDIVQWASE